MTHRLSLCIIVKNEAPNLSRCLDSVQGVVDEIILVDTGSTDETVAIAQRYTSHIYSFPWNGSFSDARNVSLQHASGDWILVLDADEVLVSDCVPALTQALQAPTHLVVNLVRQEVGAAQSPYSMVSRCFRRHPAIRFTRLYHAMIDDSVTELLRQEPQWQIVDLPPVALLHYGYEPGAIASRDKFQKARQAMERFLAEHPEDSYVCSKLGALYVELGELTRGVDLLQTGLRSPLVDAPVLYELHYHLGIAHRQLNHLELAVHHYREALRQPILDRLKLGAYHNLAALLQTHGDLSTAKTLYERTIAIDPGFAPGHCHLGQTLKALGQLQAAITHYQTAIALQPNYAEAHQNLGVVLLKMGRVSEGLTAFQRAIALHQQRNPSEAERLRQGLKAMGLSPQ